jgi:hypothetical protein
MPQVLADDHDPAPVQHVFLGQKPPGGHHSLANALIAGIDATYAVTARPVVEQQGVTTPDFGRNGLDRWHALLDGFDVADFEADRAPRALATCLQTGLPGKDDYQILANL